MAGQKANGVRSISTIAGSILLCLAAGGLSALLGPVDDWYATLRKPAWTPPGAVFGVVWTTLYVMMGIALALVILPDGKTGGRRRAVTAFVVQLVLNVAWSPIFFGLHSPAGAMWVIGALWLAIGWTVAALWSVRDLAGVMLLPYWAWVTFAVGLNAAIWRMNA